MKIYYQNPENSEKYFIHFQNQFSMKFDNKIELFLTQIDLKLRENHIKSCTTPY